MNDLRIATRQAGGAFWTGQIDEVRIWNITRTLARIAGDYRRRLLGTEPGLAAYLRLDLNVLDLGPNKITGSLGGATFVDSGAGLIDPAVDTLDPSPVLATSATFLASVNPAGSGTAVFFQYGETIAYGREAGGTNVGSGTEFQPVSVIVNGLQPGTTYHYRACRGIWKQHSLRRSSFDLNPFTRPARR